MTQTNTLPEEEISSEQYLININKFSEELNALLNKASIQWKIAPSQLHWLLSLQCHSVAAFTLHQAHLQEQEAKEVEEDFVAKSESKANKKLEH